MFFGAETMCPTSPVLPFHLSFFFYSSVQDRFCTILFALFFFFD